MGTVRVLDCERPLHAKRWSTATMPIRLRSTPACHAHGGAIFNHAKTGGFRRTFRPGFWSKSRLPHGGVRPFHHKSICLTQLMSESHVVQIWSRNTLESGPYETFVLYRVEDELQHPAIPRVISSGRVFIMIVISHRELEPFLHR